MTSCPVPREERTLLDTVADGAAELHEDARVEALRGLLGSPKTLPPKLFYDARGAELFERICTLPEYYLTRAELEILTKRVEEIAALAGPRCVLVEYGSGAGVKVRLLLDAFEEPVAYVPVDISREQLESVSREIAIEYPGLIVRPVSADYSRPLDLPAEQSAERTIAFFPGSTIGNFHPAEAAAFLRRVRRTVRRDGALLLGLDRVKSPTALNAAYNDRARVTAAFNLNVLARLNRDLGADFDLRRFAHRAFFNESANRVEMHLVSIVAQEVAIGVERISFEAGESIWTESSYKYDLPTLNGLAALAGFRVEHLWTDSEQRFWLAWLQAV
jgi:L-histidine N-alpha-methyltransferase